MAESIKSILDELCGHLKFDRRLHKQVHEYGQAFMNRNDDHVEFFGGNLLGVHPVRFRTSDKDMWFDDILEADDTEIRNRVISLDTVDESWVRGTDPMNLSCLWMVHRFFNSDLPDRHKVAAMVDTLMALHMKLISSLMAYYFPYPADPGVATATYAALNKKFALKQYGSWRATLEARCEDIVDKKSIHYQTIQMFDDDAAIQRMITDVQGRLRSMVKNMWGVFAQVREQDAKIHTVKGIVDIDGEAVVRDMTRNFTPYRKYVHEVVNDKSRFIKDDLVSVTSKAIHTMSEKLLVETLEFVSDNYGRRSQDHIEAFIDETMLHAFEFLRTNKANIARTSDLASMITRLRAVYMSSRSRDESLLKMRKLGEKIVKKAINSRNGSTIAAVRTGLMLYIVVRAFTRDHYK